MAVFPGMFWLAKGMKATMALLEQQPPREPVSIW
jgi:hypothetical protein